MKNWVCPTCGIHATLAKADVHSGEIHLTTSTGMAAGEGFYVAAHLTRCWVPCDHVPIRSWPLFRAREVMVSLIESLKAGSAS